MERIIALSQLKALGMKVEKTGIVSANRMQYGALGPNTFQTVDRRAIDLTDIESFSYNTGTCRLNCILSDNSVVEVSGGEFDSQEIIDVSLKPMPKTLGDLRNVFDLLYPDSERKMYQDVLMERDMIDMSIFDRPDEGTQPISDVIMAIYHEHIENLLKHNGYFGNMPSDKVLDDALSIQCYDHKRNLFLEWVQSHEWDGIPRVRNWFKEMFGATAEPLEKNHMADKYLEDVAQAWFVGAIRRQFRETVCDVVPILISKDQGIGKTYGVELMAGQSRWYAATALSVSHIKDFLDEVRGSVVVELAEAKQLLQGDDSETLKAFISKSFDQIRKPYARHDERCPRHFVMIATCNYGDIFTDLTGNRRYFPMFCDYTKSTKSMDTLHYEVEQLWAEALQMYKDDPIQAHALSQETKRLARVMQEFCTLENSGMTAITNYLNDPENGYTHVGARICREQILRDIFRVDDRLLISSEMEEAYRAWTTGNKEWKKIGRTVRINGKPTSSAYERICRPDEVPETGVLSFLRSSNPDEAEEAPEDIMRSQCAKFNVWEDGAVFPTEGLTSHQINRIFSEGYIYDSGLVGGEIVYKICTLP